MLFARLPLTDLKIPPQAAVAELVDAPDSKSGSLTGVRVRLSPAAPLSRQIFTGKPQNKLYEVARHYSEPVRKTLPYTVPETYMFENSPDKEYNHHQSRSNCPGKKAQRHIHLISNQAGNGRAEGIAGGNHDKGGCKTE